MGPGAALARRLSRRAWLAGAVLGAAGCDRLGTGRAADIDPTGWAGGWVGASLERGHRLLADPAPEGGAGAPRRCAVAVLGAGVAGLAAARALRQAGIDDLRVFELEDDAGGNARGHAIDGLRCPLGAHYLPVPPRQAHAVSGFLHELGLLRTQHGRTVPDERHLCHALQERLWTGQAWTEGLLPPAEPGSAAEQAYRRFSRLVAQAARQARFAVPSLGLGTSPALQALDRETFAAWLRRHGLQDPSLLWYLDYACRDDYGAGLQAVSAWAGLHYFASRHGFAAPGDEPAQAGADSAYEGVFTWPEGNAWLTRRLTAPLADRLHLGTLVRRVLPGRHEVAVEVLDARGALQRWLAREVVVALPLHVARRVLAAAPTALEPAARALDSAPWLVANVLLREPPIDRPGAPPAWDSVVYEGATGEGTLAPPEDPARLALGYVDASHQGLRGQAAPLVLTAYWAFGQAEAARTAVWRARLRDEPWQAWAQRVVAHLARVHPDLPAQVRRVDLMRYGHAMAIPAPGVRSQAALAALREAAWVPGSGPAAPPTALTGPSGTQRLHFAHADLAGYSVFEEAFTLGDAAGRRAAARLGRRASGAA
jgi:monoamine oxidase